MERTIRFNNIIKYQKVFLFVLCVKLFYRLLFERFR